MLVPIFYKFKHNGAGKYPDSFRKQSRRGRSYKRLRIIVVHKIKSRPGYIISKQVVNHSWGNNMIQDNYCYQSLPGSHLVLIEQGTCLIKNRLINWPRKKHAVFITLEFRHNKIEKKKRWVLCNYFGGKWRFDRIGGAGVRKKWYPILKGGKAGCNICRVDSHLGYKQVFTQGRTQGLHRARTSLSLT